ncbi:MAG: hypothetical protein Q4D59_10360, partial [Erysipelotrichaceae bacterium]|nr:hypothetical protein [Erysipelotrichaceae bacterium]
MKRIRNTFMCLLVCILAGTWIPVTKAKEALRLLVITETLDPEDQPHAAESFNFSDGKTLWYLDYTDPLQAEAAKRTYINDPLQEDTAIESEGEAYLLSDLCTALYEAIENREETFVLNLSDEEITASPVLHDLVQRAIQNGTVIRNSLETEGTREISSLEAELKYGASYDPQSDRWIWQPDSAAAGHRFTYRVSFSTSGLYETGRDTVRIQIPLHILSTRDGNPGDDFEISAVFEEELEEEDELGWRFRDGMIEVFNNREESSGLEGYFEISYYTGYETFEYADGSTSAPFEAEMILVHGDSEESQKTSAPSFTVDTKAEIVST